MKHFSTVLLLAIGLFLVGCEEQSVNPIRADAAQGAKLLEFAGTIKNAGVMDFPADAAVKGSVLYTFRQVILGKGAARVYDIEMESAAEVTVPQETPIGEASYNAAGKSQERIALDETGNSTLSLAYRLEGMEATAYLHIAFAADGSQLRFRKAWISPSNQ